MSDLAEPQYETLLSILRYEAIRPAFYFLALSPLATICDTSFVFVVAGSRLRSLNRRRSLECSESLQMWPGQEERN